MAQPPKSPPSAGTYPSTILSDWFDKALEKEKQKQQSLPELFFNLTGLPSFPLPQTIQDRWFKDDTISPNPTINLSIQAADLSF